MRRATDHRRRMSIPRIRVADTPRRAQRLSDVSVDLQHDAVDRKETHGAADQHVATDGHERTTTCGDLLDTNTEKGVGDQLFRGESSAEESAPVPRSIRS